MTVHMIRLIISPTGNYTLEQLNAAMNDWVSEHSHWTEDAGEDTITEADPRDPGAAPFRTGTFRFHLTDAKENLIQKCEDKLVNKVSWYRLGYHRCNHDEEQSAACAWEDQREWTAKGVTIPAAVPTFPDA